MIPKDKVEEALALIKKSPANADYFFEQLTSPEWIDPLRERRFFSTPYPAEKRGDGIAFPNWPPGEYLARMARIPGAQERVVTAFEKLPDCDNPRVYETVGDAANVLPPAMAMRLVPQLTKGLELPFQLRLPEKTTETMTRLADAGLGAAALRLAKLLFAVLPATPAAPDGSDEFSWSRRQARARFDAWEYGSLLEKSLKSLVRATGMDAFRFLCDLLEQAITRERIEKEEGPDDYSHIWRPTIEHSEKRREGLKDDLVSAVRDAGDQLAQSSPQGLSDVLEELKGRSKRVFGRLALFLLSRHPHEPTAVLEEWLGDPEDWEDSGTGPEYEEALKRLFDKLPAPVQQSFLDRIDKGPDRESYVAFRKNMDGHDPSEEDVSRYHDVWVRDRLGVLADHLSAPYKERLKGLEGKFGPAQPRDRAFRVTSGWVGEKSPLSEDETLSLDWPSFIEKLKSWEPPSTFDGPSEGGLANSVRQRVTARPQEAVQHLYEVFNVPPRYVAAILEGLREVIRDKASKTAFDWGSALTFMARVVAEAQSAEPSEATQRVRRAAAWLIQDSFEAGAASIPMEHRKEVWEVLQALTEDDDPTPEHESRYGGENMDPATLSINTARGEAFHGILRYALWVRRHLETSVDREAMLKAGFGELPEVRLVLERHLDPGTDPSVAVRAVYGQWFPWLVLLDEQWAVREVPIIFPGTPEHAPLFWAAWGAYIVFCQPYTNVLAILRPIYARVTDGLKGASPRKERVNPAERLAQHLMAFYWRGEITLERDDLVARFFATASDELRGQALDWVGQVLARSEDAPPPDDVKRRLRELWEWRANSQTAGKDELQAFGWWFGSGRLDEEWSLQVLESILARSIMPEPDHMVAERLAAMVGSHPTGVVRCLDRMIDIGSRGWSIHGWLDQARTILDTALKSGGEAKGHAEKVIHKLGALRFRAFRSLLKTLPIATHEATTPEHPSSGTEAKPQ